MIAAVAAAAVLVLVLVAALWSRLAATRSERRSVEGYGRALDTLGGVAKRSESGAPVQVPTGDELARPHVRRTGDVQPHARPPAHPVSPAPRVRIRPPGAAGTMPVFSDLAADEPAGPAAGRAAGGRRGGIRGGAARSDGGQLGKARSVPAPTDEPTIVLPVGLHPAVPGGNGGDPRRGVAAVAPPGPPEVVDEPLTMVEDPLTMVVPAVPAVPPAPPAPAVPAAPAVPVAPTAPTAPKAPTARPEGPVFGPPLPGEVTDPVALVTPEDEGGVAESPVLVFDGERGAFAPSAPASRSAARMPGPGVLTDDDLEEGAGSDPGELRSQRFRRAATGAAAAVAIGAIGAGGWQLAHQSSPVHAGAPAASTSGGHTATTSSTGGSATKGSTPAGGTGHAGGGTRGSGGTPPASTPPASTPPAGGSSGALQPTSTVTGSVVAYAAPAGSYTITFAVTGTSNCWLGAQGQLGGPYLWMQTVPPGGTASYTASGPVVIRLGAPPVVSVHVNGRLVALPAGKTQPYDLSFSPSSQAA